jgi:hypothetical protein
LDAPCKQLLKPPKFGLQEPQVLQPANARVRTVRASIERFIIFLLEEIAKVAVERFFDEQLYANIPKVQIGMNKFPTISKLFLTLVNQSSVTVSHDNLESNHRSIHRSSVYECDLCKSYPADRNSLVRT